MSEQSKDVLEKLIELTMDNKIKWDYLDNNDEIVKNLNFKETLGKYAKLGSVITDDNFRYFDKSYSFYATVKSNFVILYRDSQLTELVLMIVPRTYRDIGFFKEDKHASKLTKLLNVVKSGFPSKEQVISDILDL